MKAKKKRENPVDKGQTQVKTGITCKYCDKVCLNEDTLSIHVNNEHADRQPMFQCAFCGLKINEFSLYTRHLGEHSDKVHKCYQCSEQFDNARLLRKHISGHINQCPLCFRVFESLLVLADHVNKEHGQALEEDKKKCPLCDATFDTFDELSKHCKEHRSYSCDICYAGFVSEPLLVEHHMNDHPQGQPAWSERTSTPRAETTTSQDLEVEKALEVVRTPDPDPFADIEHPAIGQLHKDDKHKVECEVCHRYLKSFNLRVEHVKNFHPTVFYDCVFCPGAVFYTLRDLLSHCKENHFVCQQCDSAHNDQNSLKEHMVTEHPAPAQAPDPSKRPGFVCGKCSMYCCTVASFKIHLVTHKKTSCPYCPQKFYDAVSRNKHMDLKHSNRHDRRLNCRMAPACKETFNNIREYPLQTSTLGSIPV